VESDPTVTRFTARGDEIVSKAGTVVARVEYFGWARRQMRIRDGAKSYRSRSFWHPRTFQETDTGRTVLVFKRSWLSMRFRLVFPSGNSLESSSTSRALGRSLSLRDQHGIVIEVFPSQDAPPAGARDHREDPHMRVVVYREEISDLLLVIVLAVAAIREVQTSAAPSGAGWGVG
jgi:hypothetical protein